MASRAQLEAEQWWGREVVPAGLNGLFRDLCAHYKSDPFGGGTKGNEFHLYGRHRSLEWALRSQYCENRDYGTRDARDRTGEHRHIRAFDLKLNRAQMIAVSHYLDTAVRAGGAPMVAEWFGTFNNRTVTGWYEGHVSSADSSHLEHVHVGLWTKYADDDMTDLFEIMTGDAMSAADTARIEHIEKIVAGIANRQVIDTANLAKLAGRDFVDEQAVVDGVLGGLGGLDADAAATALKAVLTAEQVTALAAALAVP